MTENEDSLDRKTIKWIKKKFPRDWQIRLKKMDTRKSGMYRIRERNLCFKHDILRLFNHCLRETCVFKYKANYGDLTIIQKKNYIVKMPCRWCNKEHMTHYYVALRLCERCIKRVQKKAKGKDYAKEYIKRTRPLHGQSDR